MYQEHLDETYTSIPAVPVPRQRTPVLVMLRGPHLGRRFAVKGDRVILGRNPGRSDLAFPEDREISGRHCQIEHDTSDNRYLVSDLESTNGTLVNGQKVTAAELHEGDKLMIGQAVFKFAYEDMLDEEFYHEVDRRMNIDELTGLVVLREFQHRLREALTRCQQNKQPLTLMMMDLDGLKAINDKNGHHVGAGTISAVGKLLGQWIPQNGLVTRYGGDEFTAFVERLPRAPGMRLARRFVKRLAEQKLSFEQVIVTPSISIGVAVFPEDAATFEVLTRRADEALYRAKAAGRGCVCS